VEWSKKISSQIDFGRKTLGIPNDILFIHIVFED
jgi:hypothetical protein